ncbi:MAG: ribosome biogenesis GTP-binding protein YihA/YsxC [Proteobacteria bacterium]|nr:ribosome biogenesis GTP-binding protein YihA/YsxC [Pseudomonadota bacterium]
MIIKSAEFIKSAAALGQYPDEPFPEVAFAGKSNVGKSTLINTLVNRKGLVKTSSTPGRTQLINFFLINREFRFVDLPGYGYAKAPVAEKKKWGPMVEAYLQSREELKAVVLLIDIRRDPDQKELDFMLWMNRYNLNQIYVLTKADKLSKAAQTLQMKAIARGLSMDPENLILFSSKTRMGKEKIWEAISGVLNLSPSDPTPAESGKR